MAELEETSISCGVRQLYGVRDKEPKEVLYEALKDVRPWGVDWQLNNMRFGIILFSDKVARPRGAKYSKFGGVKFAEFVIENKLGKIISSDIITNPNTSNKIQVWVWQLNRPALIKWYNNAAKEQIEFDYATDGTW